MPIHPLPMAPGTQSALSSEDVAKFRRRLLAWYGTHRRDLPWRRTHDPYRIWVSEIMLQQTRVAAVLEHYARFLTRFPDVSALAAAPESSVLALWSGLGYYRRARMMHRCAQNLVAECGGKFPRTAEALLALPGIGRYTAAAIASIAFGEQSAVVDGNVERVLSRTFGRSLSASECWDIVPQLISPARPGDFNQAMMELGATICTPRKPNCMLCPLRGICSTRGEGLPAKAKARQSKKEIWYVLVHRDSRVRLVLRSSADTLMAGMWELPQIRPNSSSTQPWRTFKHSITVTDYTVHVLKRPALKRGEWVELDQLSHVPITGLTRKILKASGLI